jgi:phage protein D
VIPRKGAIIAVAMGYGTAQPLGRFVVDKVTPPALLHVDLRQECGFPFRQIEGGERAALG